MNAELRKRKPSHARDAIGRDARAKYGTLVVVRHGAETLTGITAQTATLTPSGAVGAPVSRGDRPNSTTRKRYAMALAHMPCMTCAGYCDWETVGKPDSGTFGHRLGDSAGGKWSPDNIGAQCWTCNNGVKSMVDLRGIGDIHFVPYTLPSQRDADEWWQGKYAHLDRERMHRESIVRDILRRG